MRPARNSESKNLFRSEINSSEKLFQEKKEKMKLSKGFIFGSLLNGFHSVTEDTQNLLVQCSIKPGDVDSSRMTKEECEHVRGVFKEKSEQIAFIVKQQTDDGYCVDIKCVNDSILRKFKAQRKKNEETKLDEDSAEHKFTGPKREPTLTEIGPPKRITKLPGEPVIKKGLGLQGMVQKWKDAKAEDNTPDSITNNYSSVCSLNDEDNQNTCCGPDDKSTCCDYNQKSRRTYGTSRFGLGWAGRIVGGQEAGNLKKSMAYITKANFMHQFCGGVIIHPNWVLTAAHCLQDYCDLADDVELDIVVKVGKTTKDNFQYDAFEETYYAKSVHCHSQNCKADGSPRVNDVALVRVERAISELKDVIEVAQMPLSYQEPIKSKKCIMLGWGDTKGTGHENVLKQVEIPLVSNEQCNDDRWRSCGIRSCMMCAGGLNEAPCAGDSGGPLFCPWHNGLYQLHGIYSYGRCGADVRKPSVFTRVSHYMDWIKDTISPDLLSAADL